MEILYTEIFEKWLKGLRDQRAKVSVASRIERIEEANFGDYRSVGSSVSELRVNVGKGYRVYYTIRKSTTVILLCGGDKSSQRRDIAHAQRMASEL
jgi:putative addiction module killer protein